MDEHVKREYPAYTRNPPVTRVCLDLTRDGQALKASLYSLDEVSEKTLRGYERYAVNWSDLEGRCATLAKTLNSLASQTVSQRQGLAALQRVGNLLFDELLSPRIKEQLLAWESTFLVLSIDDGLVHIPWELLWDGETFLCLRHAMGRVVRTEQEVPPHRQRQLAHPLRVLIVADPLGNLPSAYEEGRALCDALQRSPDIVQASLKTTSISSRSVRERVRDFDIVHFAGHASYSTENPADNGWLLRDGKLSSHEIRKLIGGPRPLPSLIFSNACQSGQTAAWRTSDHFQQDIFGIANAFLLAGVRHYIGTFFDIADEISPALSTAFYERLLAGAPVGQALLEARHAAIDAFGLHTSIWASYMLYGDPCLIYRGASGALQILAAGGQESRAEQLSEGDSIVDLMRMRARIDSHIESRRRHLCVMFADLVGSTGYFEHHGDIAGRAWVQGFRDRLTALVEEEEGTVVKTLGDGILATFPRADGALRVARKLRRDGAVAPNNDLRGRVRVALHRGSVVVEAGDITGDTVNVVCRLVSEIKPGEIIISREVKDALNTPAPDLEQLGTCRLKGRDEPIQIFRVSSEQVAMAAQNETVVTRSGDQGVVSEMEPAKPRSTHVVLGAAVTAALLLTLVVGIQRDFFHLPFVSKVPHQTYAVPVPEDSEPGAVPTQSAMVGAEAFVVRGMELERQGDLQGAAAAFRAGLEVAPRDPYLQAFAEQLAVRLDAEARDARRQRVDALLERIAAWKQGQDPGSEGPTDSWTSRPIIFAFLGFQEVGQNQGRAGTAEYLEFLLGSRVGEDSRITVVERELLDTLLEELDLSTTELVDRATNLPIGRLLAARVLGVGKLFHLPEGTRLTVRLFEAETSVLLTAVDLPLAAPARSRTALDNLATRLRTELTAAYPLRARVARVEDGAVIVDAGYRTGLRVGQRFARLLAEPDPAHVILDTAHSLRVREVRPDEAVLRPDSTLPPLQPRERLQVIDEGIP